MTQNVFADIDPATKTGTQLATDLNNFKDSILSSHLGTSSPTYSVEGTLWMDNTSTNLVAYVEDTGSDDVPIFQIDATNNVARVAMDADRDSYIVADTDDEIDVVLATSVTYTFKAAGVVAPGIYLGGTGAANLLTDYETGSFSPGDITVSNSGGITGTYSSYGGKWTKIGDTVFVDIVISGTTMAWPTSSAFLILTGLPFTPASGSLSSGVFAASGGNTVFGSAVVLDTGNISLTNCKVTGNASSIAASFSYKV